MSESSADKTKRNFAAYLTRPTWQFQYSIFYQSPGDSINLLEDQKVFRQELGRKFPNQPFLIRIQTLNRGTHQAYLTIYTTVANDGIYALADRYFGTPDVNILTRKLSEGRRNSQARAILTQRPHDLVKLFGKVRIRRYGVINKHLLEALEGTQGADEN